MRYNGQLANGYIDPVADFAVTGDGSVADAARVLACFNEAVSSGSSVFLKQLSLTLNAQITVNGTAGSGQHLTVYGDGISCIKMGNSYPTGTGGVLLKTYNVDHVKFDGVNFDGNIAGLGITTHVNYLSGLYVMQAAGSVRVSNCAFANFIGDCLDVQNSSDVKCNHNDFRNSIAAQIYVKDSNFVTMSSNLVRGIGYYAGSNALIGAVQLLSSGSRYVKFHDNIILDSPDTASKTEGCSDVIYSGNIVDGYGKDGLKIQNSPGFSGPQVYRGQFIGNQISNAHDARSDGRGGIVCHNLTGCVIKGNVINGGLKTLYAEYGIAISNGNERFVISDNVIGTVRDKSINITKNTAVGTAVNRNFIVSHNRIAQPIAYETDTVNIVLSDNNTDMA